jgi:hypothetical protein
MSWWQRRQVTKVLRRLASCEALMLAAPQHPSHSGVDIVIEEKAHYPAALSSRDASSTSAAVRSGNAVKMASVSYPLRR